MHKIKLAKSNISKLKFSSVCIILYNTPHCSNTQYYTSQLYKLKYITQSNSFELFQIHHAKGSYEYIYISLSHILYKTIDK